MDKTKLPIAAAGIKKLESIHSQFINYIHNLEDKQTEIGLVDTTEDPISMLCLNKHLIVEHKIVAIDDMPKYNEYAFYSDTKDKLIAITAIYLSANGRLLASPDDNDGIFDYNNSYLAEHLLDYVASKLLHSEVFKPISLG